MSDMKQWQLTPEAECDDQDEYPNDAQIRRDIMGWQEEYAAWEGNELPLRTTLFTHDGRLEPAMMTREQQEARLAELAADKPAEAVSEQYTLLAQLLTWARREATTPDEAAQVNALRQRAAMLLKQADVRELVSNA